ncbi:hypothetical protein [Mycolicibacter sinensis]|uniref:hypothetical protein n=1 Tax=Mycolicibacter sinensis (strain JDM601) TaxID=875328 RepID=UPI0013F4C79A|nr:hypothetical protein [Mycolicibacter sinensis]
MRVERKRECGVAGEWIAGGIRVLPMALTILVRLGLAVLQPSHRATSWTTRCPQEYRY